MGERSKAFNDFCQKRLFGAVEVFIPDKTVISWVHECEEDLVNLADYHQEIIKKYGKEHDDVKAIKIVCERLAGILYSKEYESSYSIMFYSMYLDLVDATMYAGMRGELGKLVTPFINLVDDIMAVYQQREKAERNMELATAIRSRLEDEERRREEAAEAGDEGDEDSKLEAKLA